jgi:hypothetical protein
MTIEKPDPLFEWMARSCYEDRDDYWRAGLHTDQRSESYVVGSSIQVRKDQWGSFTVHGATTFGTPDTFNRTKSIDKAFASLYALIDEIKERAKMLSGPETLEINFESTMLATLVQESDIGEEGICFDE